VRAPLRAVVVRLDRRRSACLRTSKCKQYVELDQTKDECATLHACGGDCPLLKVFRPPAPVDNRESAGAAELPADPEPGK
jgi:hypothetical protein